MLVTLNIKNESMSVSFLNFIKTLDYIEIKDETQITEVKKQNKKNKFTEFAGIWKDRDITLQSIREDAWKK